MPNVVVYTAKPCGFCTAALRFLKEVKNVEVKEVDLSKQHELRMKLIEETGQRTVPMIFIGEKFIGGYTELRALDRNNELDALLELNP
jgi:glutaredoxin 3